MARRSRSDNLGYSIGPVCAVRPGGSSDLEFQQISSLAISGVDDGQPCLLGLLDHHPTAFIPLLGFLLLGYAGLYLVTGNRSKSLIWILCAVILAYAWLEKKYTVLPEEFLLAFHILTVIGLSCTFSFEYCICSSKRQMARKTALSPGAYLLYTLNFTTLISGPIQRYNEFARDQFATSRCAGTTRHRPATGAHRSRLLQGQRPGDAPPIGPGGSARGTAAFVVVVAKIPVGIPAGRCVSVLPVSELLRIHRHCYGFRATYANSPS